MLSVCQINLNVPPGRQFVHPDFHQLLKIKVWVCLWPVWVQYPLFRAPTPMVMKRKAKENQIRPHVDCVPHSNFWSSCRTLPKISTKVT